MLTGVKKILRILALNLLVLLLLLLLLECGLRFFTGAPRGIFNGWISSELGLYPENAKIPMFAVRDWLVETNKWGFRGGELALKKAPDVTRVAMIGDSVTDGFFVENQNNFPSFTEAALKKSGFNVEVINGANGGTSIDRELAILRDAITQFEPEIVVLTFVCNDVHVLSKVDDNMLLHQKLNNEDALRKLSRILFVRSAVGELVLDQVLRHINPDYAREQDKPKKEPNLSPQRYVIEGGDQFEENARRFMQRYRNDDGLILSDELSPEMQTQLQRYFQAWDLFMQHAATHHMQPVFVYFPAYAQVYDAHVSMKIRDLLKAHSEQRGVPFLDMTAPLRAHPGEVLHLAPVDYHLNPKGNQVMGEALAAFLIEKGLVRRSAAGADH